MLACVLGSDEQGDRRWDRSTRDSGRCVNESGKRVCTEIFEPGLSASVKPGGERERRPCGIVNPGGWYSTGFNGRHLQRRARVRTTLGEIVTMWYSELESAL